ncbi:sigma factor-like helix-turn-helix DNA-binding protein [Gemmatimonas sp.]
MAKRNTNRRRAAFAAIGLLVETGCGVFTLFLASRDASYSQALAAKQWLAALIAQRVRAYVEQLGSPQVGESADTADGDLLMPPFDVEWMVAEATARVMAALPRCASRSVVDFERWLERQIADAIDEDPDRNPPSPASPSGAAQVSASWALHRLPIPRAQRDALVTAVLQELTPQEREVLKAMQEPTASWVDVAERLGLSLFAAKRLHRHADDRAHEIAVRLAAQAAGVASTPAHAAAA